MPRPPKYLDEVDENKIRKDLIYACEASMPEVEPADDENTKHLLQEEVMLNHLSIA